jgi:Pentapeptide repeats (8 copies)
MMSFHKHMPQPKTPLSRRDRIAIWTVIGALLSGLAAIATVTASVIFTHEQNQTTARQLKIAQEGQVTDRYNAATTNLGSRSSSIRLGGIYALQRLMQDSRREQPTVVAILCAFVRDAPTGVFAERHFPGRLPTDTQTALTVVATRNTAHDGPANVLDLNFANLPGADLIGAHLGGVHLISANLAGAHLNGAGLNGAQLNNANLAGAHLNGAHLKGAHLTSAYLKGADLTGAELTGAVWPVNARVPTGWVRDTHSGRLRRPT